MKVRGVLATAVCVAVMLGTGAVAQDRLHGSGSAGSIGSGIGTTGSLSSGTAGRAPRTVGGSQIQTRIPRYGGGLSGAFDPEADSAVGPGARSGGPAGTGPRGARHFPSIIE